MDSVTHALLGAVTAQLGFRQRIGRDATWAAALAAYSPDLDSFIPAAMRALGDQNPFLSMLVHRGITHSLLAAPLMALLVAGGWGWLRRRVLRWRGRGVIDPRNGAALPGFGLLYACVLAAMLTHPLLDVCTSYGTQLLAPLTNHRFAIDSVAIVDILYTPILVLTLAACWLVRKVRRGRPTATATLAIAWTGFLLSVGYLAAGRGMHDWAIRKALAAAGPRHVAAANAYPSMGTIFLWRVVIRTPEDWLVVRVHHLAGRTPAPRVAPRQDDAWIRQARGLAEVRIYDWFAMGQLRAESTQINGLHVVAFHDMRYSWIADGVQSLWPLRVAFNSRGDLVEVRRLMERGDRSIGQLASAMWRDLWAR